MRMAHSGATDTSSAKPENHSAAEPGSQGMPETRQTELDPHTVAYLDFGGSHAGTLAHLRENGRITLDEFE